ncbi:protein jag [Patescibacteria group bacterium]
MNKETTKKIIEDVLNKLSVSFDDVEAIDRGESFVFMIRTQDARYLIGSRGANLSALNHVVKRVAEQQNDSDERLRFIVDVNNYQENRNEEIKNKAVIIASRVKSFKTSAEMDPMSSYERMLVHSALADDCDVETESTGFGRDRRVVIKCKTENL